MKRETPVKGAVQYRAAELERADDKPRTIRFVASDESVDRYGDIIRVRGWNLDSFRRNPVLLFAHQSRELPLGTADAWIEGRALMADATFLPPGVSDFADEVWRVVEAGALRAVSVGFLPTENPNVLRDEKNDYVTGFEFIGQDLLELSIVPVPANPQALAVARSVSSEATTRRLFALDTRASAQVEAEHRRHTLTLARLRPGQFDGGSNVTR